MIHTIEIIPTKRAMWTSWGLIYTLEDECLKTNCRYISINKKYFSSKCLLKIGMVQFGKMDVEYVKNIIPPDNDIYCLTYCKGHGAPSATAYLKSISFNDFMKQNTPDGYIYVLVHSYD